MNMDTDTNRLNISYAPTDTSEDLYPDTDGEPMAASDLHLEILIWLIQALREYFAAMPDTYVSGRYSHLLHRGQPARCRRTGCPRHFRHRTKAATHLQSVGRGENPRLRHGVLKQNDLSQRLN